MEEAREQAHRMHTRSVLERIDEFEELTVFDETQAPRLVQPAEVDITNRSMEVTAPRVSVPEQEIDISDLPTQKLETVTQQESKCAGELEIMTSPKRQRSMGFISFRLSQQQATESEVADKAEKENLTTECPSPKKRARRSTVLNEISQIGQDVPRAKNTERGDTAMLQQVGQADIETHQPDDVQQPGTAEKSQRQRSGSSETPLGSLDRTKVSLGDSEQTTDSERFMRDEWGTEGTMMKILKCIKAGVSPITVSSLILKGPVIPGHKRIIAARCFTSILKLKQHRFINIIKNPETLEIEDITLGPIFD